MKKVSIFSFALFLIFPLAISAQKESKENIGVSCDISGTTVTFFGHGEIDALFNTEMLLPEEGKTIIIEDGITSIGAGAFANRKNIKSVSLPNTVVSIGSSAFRDCKSLSSINIPNSVATIGASAFKECDSLTTIIITSEDVTIGDFAFQDCKNLTITVPHSLASIGHEAFSGVKKGNKKVTNRLLLMILFTNHKDIMHWS